MGAYQLLNFAEGVFHTEQKYEEKKKGISGIQGGGDNGRARL